jgi:hypothetical protein
MARTSDAHVTGLGFRLGGFVAASICPLGGAMIAAPFIREAASFATVSPDANHRTLLPLFGRAAASDEQRRSTGGADIAPKNVQGVAILDYALDKPVEHGEGEWATGCFPNAPGIHLFRRLDHGEGRSFLVSQSGASISFPAARG